MDEIMSYFSGKATLFFLSLKISLMFETSLFPNLLGDFSSYLRLAFDSSLEVTLWDFRKSERYASS